MTRRRRRRFWRLPRAAVLRIVFLTPEEPRLPDAEWNRICAAVRNRDGNTCQLRRLWGWGWKCGRPAECVDHIRPVSLGGSNDPSNCRAACMRCNTRKRHRPPLGWAIGRIIRAWGTVGLVAWALFSVPDIAPALIQRSPAPAIAAQGGRWAVVAPGGAVVARFDAEADARRAAAGWNAAGGAGQLGIAEIPVSP